MLNGTMIVNAKRDGEGRYTDHGNFVLKMGELFVKHIHDYDNGYTLQAAVNFATATSFLDKTGKNLPFESLESTLALNRGEGWSLATIGKGAIECTKQGGICEIGKANRDVNNAQKFEKEIDIKPIFLFYTNLRPSDFKNLPKNPRQFLENIFNNIARDLGFNPSQQDSNQFPNTEDQQTSQDQSYKTSKQLQQELTEINEEISDYDLTTRYLDNPVRKLAVILAIWDIQKIDPEVTTTEAFAAAFPAIIKAEQQAPMQRWNVALVVDDLMLIGGALALLALTPYALKLGDELNDIYQKYILYKKQSGDNVKDIPKPAHKDQSGATPPAPGFEPGEDPDEWTKNKDGRWHHPDAKNIKGVHNRPNVQNAKLKQALNEIYRLEDTSPGGSFGKLIQETRLGHPIKRHMIKVGERVKQLRKISRQESLSPSDKKTIQRLINYGEYALKIAKSN